MDDAPPGPEELLATPPPPPDPPVTAPADVPVPVPAVLMLVMVDGTTDRLCTEKLLWKSGPADCGRWRTSEVTNADRGRSLLL